MKVTKTDIEGLVEISPSIFEDPRGYFFESYSQQKLEEYLSNVRFVQDNQSFSAAHVLRGLHFQLAPFAQGKLVRVLSGSAIDVVVDLRKDSPTFGQTRKFLLESTKHNMVYVPEGFGHGFVTLEPCMFFYKCTNVYNKASESGIIWNDPELKIDWEVKNPLVSDKDAVLQTFAQFKEQL